MPGVGGYREKAVISSFLAAFPMDAPHYLVFVLLFEPKGTQETGGEVLASAQRRADRGPHHLAHRAAARHAADAGSGGGRNGHGV